LSRRQRNDDDGVQDDDWQNEYPATNIHEIVVAALLQQSVWNGDATFMGESYHARPDHGRFHHRGEYDTEYDTDAGIIFGERI
jgi:hypothetical protein